MIFSGVLFSMCLLMVSVSALPLLNKFLWVPDAKGALHLINLLEPFKQDLELPFFTGEKKVNLSLYTQNNPDIAERISLDDDFAYPHLNVSHPTRFVIHGWTSNAERFNDVKEAYIQTGKHFNVVMVDWRIPAKSDYYVARIYCRLVGQYVAKVIKHLVEKKNLTLDLVNVIGHSLGAQAAAVVGNRLKGKLARIVGLDAAAPLFGFAPRKNILDRGDAQFVEGIHTNGGLAGWLTSYGHADFFPNGGSSQPGCGVLDLPVCSHIRAQYLFTESINSKELIGTRCRSMKRLKRGQCKDNPQAVMGEWTPSTTRGSYYLETNGKSPYAKYTPKTNVTVKKGSTNPLKWDNVPSLVGARPFQWIRARF